MKKKFKLQIEEEILWEGRFCSLEEGPENMFIKVLFRSIELAERFVFFGAIIFILYMYLIGIIQGPQIIYIFLFIVAYFLFVLLAAFFEQKKEKSKHYILTNQRVLFFEWFFFKGHIINSVTLKKVDKIWKEEFENDIMTIYFMGVELGDFKNTNHYPALINIKNGDFVYQRINEVLSGI